MEYERDSHGNLCIFLVLPVFLGLPESIYQWIRSEPKKELLIKQLTTYGTD